MSRHEAHDVHQAARRMLRGLVRRAAEGDTLALEALAQLEAEASIATNVAVSLMNGGEQMATTNRPEGYSYTELGAVLGTSRQAARKRGGVGMAARSMTTVAVGSGAWYAQPRA